MDGARSLLFCTLAVCPLLWVAIYNGYPTVYPDTASYIFTGAFGIALPPYRSPGYSVFIWRTSFGASAWFTILVQTFIVVVLLFFICKHVIGGDAKFRDHCLLAIACMLAALTSLPWETSILMPDIFAGVVFLAIFLLAFHAQLKWTKRLALAAILTISVGAHISLLPIAVLFVAALGVARVAYCCSPPLQRRGVFARLGTVWRGVRKSPASEEAGYSGRVTGAPSAKAALAWVVVPLLVAGIWTANLNRGMGLGFKVSPSGNEFLFGRLISDGLAGDFLRANCTKNPYVACSYLDDLPKSPEQFLFWSPMRSDMERHGDEVSEIVHGTLAAYPLRFAWGSIHETLRQVVTFRTGQEVRDLALHAPNSNAAVIRQVFPRDFPAFANSRLIRGLLDSLANAAARTDTVVFWLSAVACLALAWTKRMVAANRFFYSAILFLVLNAGICATFAGVYDRYQSRVAWLVPLCLGLYVCSLVKERMPVNS